MKITNKFNVPETLVALASRDYYSKGKADYSVTELISPPRVNRLRRQHADQMEQDVSDMLWQLLGSALHVVAERGQAKDHITEERLFCELGGVTLSGAIDIQKRTAEGLILMDYKFTSVWAVMREKPEWEQQLNMYAWLVRKVKDERIAGLRIVALIRDWNRRESVLKADYPPAPIHVVDIPVWTQDEAEAFISRRIDLHQDGKTAIDLNDELPLCNDEDRWQRSTTYAVKKEGRKTAIRVFESKTEADQLAEKEKGYVEIRRGEAIRCTGNYCGVNQWCSQYRQENAASDAGGGLRPEGRQE
jgi:hypothetical protein